jgi:predicted DNA-binding ribbon-helix-helix protein
MGNVVNLRTHRKRTERKEKADRAAERRAQHGKTKAQRQQTAAQKNAGRPQSRPSQAGDWRRRMKSQVVKRSIVIANHKTSVSLEDAFWNGLKEIAASRSMPLSDLVSSIDSQRQHGNLSSAIRLFVLDHYRSKAVKSDDASEEFNRPRHALAS